MLAINTQERETARQSTKVGLPAISLNVKTAAHSFGSQLVEQVSYVSAFAAVRRACDNDTFAGIDFV